MKNLNKLIAMSLAVMAVGSLAACNYEKQRLSTGTQREEGTSAVRGEQQQGAQDLNNLQAGRELNYYTDQFNRMGYSIFDANWGDNSVTYDLRKDNERQRVTLDLEEQAGGTANRQTASALSNRRVSDIEVRELRRMDQQALQRDQNWSRIQQQVQKLQPGKQPHEYISQLSQMGMIEEFNHDRGSDKADIQLSVLTNPQGQQVSQAQQQRAAGTQEGNLDERILQVNMQVDPQTNRVTSINVDENNAWGL